LSLLVRYSNIIIVRFDNKNARGCVKFSNMVNLATPGERLRAFRKERGLSGQALAQALGCTKGTVSYWEAGRTPLPWTVSLALEATYGVAATWLDQGTGPMWLVPGVNNAEPSEGGVEIAFLTPALAFNTEGQVQKPHPDSPSIRFSLGLLKEIGGSSPIEPANLAVWRVLDEDMVPTLPKGAWVLVDTTQPILLEDQALYLVRLDEKELPCLRRVTRMVGKGGKKEILIGVDAPGRLPLHFPEARVLADRMLLARARWVGISLA